MHVYGVNGSVTTYLGDGGSSGWLGNWWVTGDGPGLDMSLFSSSCAGSSGGSWYNSIEEYWQMCWLHGMGGIGGLGGDAHGDCIGTGGFTGGEDWVIVMVGWVLGDGGVARGGARSEKLGGL